MPRPARTALTTPTRRRACRRRSPGRAVLHGGMAAVLVLAAVGCGGDERSTTATVAPGGTTPATSSTTTTAGSATTAPGPTTEPGPGTSSTPEPGSPGASMVAVVDAYIAAVAAGDLEAAWDLLDERSQSALGGFDAFEELRSGLAEGIGAWSAAEGRTSHVIRLDDDAAVVLLRGTVPLEGPPAPAAEAVLVRGTGDEARVSPFEQTLPEGRSIDFDPPPSTEVPPAATVGVTVPGGLAVTVAVDAGDATTPEPVQQGEHRDVYQVVLPATAAPVGHVVTVAVADPGGDRTADSGLWPQSGSPSSPSSAGAVARDFVAAWTSGDRQRLAELGQPAAVQQALDVADEAARAWVFQRCEGAAGSVYCTWTDDAGRLVVRVANITDPRVVTELRLA